MKKALVSILFLLVTVNLLAPDSTNKNLWNSISPDSELVSGTDTLRNNPSVLIDPFNLELLSPSSGVQFYKDGIVFLSHSKRNEKMLERHLSFGNIESYYASLKDSVLGRPKPFSPTYSFPFPSEGITFNNDFSIMYYSKISKEDSRVKIYRAKLSPGRNSAGWTMDISPLAFCDNNNYTHPTLSSNGKIMIFSSDMPRSIGGMDLFITRYENGKWTAPQNLGNTVNSTGNELYPFLDSEKNLFFSSDGLQGYGGYDIFTCRFNGTGWEVPLNLSKVINTSKDEVAFTVNRNRKKSAFFTTRKKSGIRGMQLLRISLNKRYYPNDSTSLPAALYSIAITEFDITAQKGSEAERIETERLEAERLEAERLEAERLKAERLEAEKQKARDVVIYKVQFLSSTKSKGQYKISIGGKSYNTYEYFYKGAWRLAIGEFSNLEDAIELRNKCRQSGYNQAFVIAFENNVRSLDLSLFKR
ncbi:MAG: PD40 domain-containing protein [Bacteroidetes bacterium]|nr:PD40 domain-containing protein [Bacteroidota bacterium]